MITVKVSSVMMMIRSTCHCPDERKERRERRNIEKDEPSKMEEDGFPV